MKGKPKMRDILVCTVGTSLIGNIIRSNDLDLKKCYEENNSQGIAVELCRHAPDDRLCGAEINSINSIIEKCHLTSRGALKLLVSDTDEGQFIGRVLCQYYKSSKNKSRFEVADFEVIEGLNDVDVNRFRNEGLRNLVRHISKTVKQYSSERILINATGGYKAQISFAGMIGQALEIPVCYLFEKFSEVIQLPPQPVSLDLSFWLEYVDLFFQLDSSFEADEIFELPDERFQSLIENIEVNGQYLYSLSPIGQLFHESLQYRFNQQRSILLPASSSIPVKKRKIRYEDSNKGKHKGLEQYLEKVKPVSYLKEIYTHYYNPDLTKPNTFRKSAKGLPGQVEGWFSNNGSLTKFDIITTAKTPQALQACIVDLNERFD